MKRLCKRIISGVFAFVILFFACMPPAYASGLPDVEVSVDVVDFGTWLFSCRNMIGNWLTSIFDKDVCGLSPNTDGRHNFVQRHTQVDGKTGLYYICEYCGKSAGEVGKEAYDNQVAELPATGITSDGHLIWQPTVKDIVFPFTFRGLLSESASVNVLPWSHVSGASESSLSANSSGTGFDMRVQNCSSIVFAELSIKFNAPVSGLYFCGPYSFSYSVVSRPNGEIVSDTKFVDENLSPLYVSFGNAISFNFGRTFQSAQCSSGVASFNFPIYRVVPDSAVDTSAGGQYSVTTRPTSITGGNYGIIGDDGEITTITNNNQIINETNNTYYNPATGETKPILDWSYNYTDRSYKVTLESGDTYTITYGDENIVIKEGDVTYNIYYMVDGTGSGDPDSSPSVSVCPHVWTETSRTEPGCTSPGKVVYTCSQCGQTKSETLKALGHDWQVLRTVQTVYDENGNVIQQGYTIYQCSVCGEQYKDADSTGPPDNTVNDGGLIEWLNGLIKHLSDNLSGAVDLILRFFQEIPKLFGGFLDFLSAMFPYLPDDIIFLLTFGIAALVFVGVIKAIRR